MHFVYAAASLLLCGYSMAYFRHCFRRKKSAPAAGALLLGVICFLLFGLVVLWMQ